MMLSLCAIVKNEEKSLSSCLSSVKGVVDEIVVVDTGSTDRTPEIAREFGARVYHFEWCNDFAAARNESLKYVRGDWVLVLDADEVLTPEIVPLLKQAILQADNLVVNLVREEVGATGSPYSLVSRLFRNHPAVRFSRPYHEMVDDSVVELLQRESQWQVGYLSDVAILHYGYQPEAIASKHKFQKAQAAMEGYLANHPNDVYVCSKLGALYIQSGDIARGVQLLKRSLDSGSVDDLVLYELHYHLGIAYEHLQQLSLAKYHYQAATQLPILPKLKLAAYNNLGNVLKDNSKLQAAKTVYETALQIEPSFAVGYYNLGMTLKVLGRLEDAIASYQKAIDLNPDYADAYQNLGVALLKVGSVSESLSAFKRAIALHEQRNSSEAQRLRQGLREMGFNV
ncbi:glycosyltransferase [Argonema antarcticum]|uniref:glycosyltransferase n=1 Tax=Argonema antarcticum TaxID=2942763 RepID=UPI0020115B56|nr:glycosyltransferase [Argonema antarcticum]MCL1470268.1 tetratricopeptide repeat protein [Argonema antarcticum A004/B2]